MKTLTFGIAILHLASLSYAAPGSAPHEARQEFGSNVTFQGAGPNPPSYSLHVPYDGSTFKIGGSSPRCEHSMEDVVILA